MKAVNFLYICTLVLFTGKSLFSQSIRHSYRFNNNFSASKPDCGPDLISAKDSVNDENILPINPSAGYFFDDSLPACGLKRTLYHTNYNWGLKYPNTSGLITDNYTIQLYIKTTKWSPDFMLWSRIIDFSNGTKDDGIYYKKDALSNGRCLDFYPEGVKGSCPYFNDTTYYLLTFTRNSATNIIDVYVDTTLFVSYNDITKLYIGVAGTPIYINRDDIIVRRESSEANIAFLSFSNEYSNQADVKYIYNNICQVIEPNTAEFTLSSSNICDTSNIVTITYTGNILPPATGYSFDWNWDGGKILSGSGIGPYIIKWNSSGVKNIGLTVTDNNCFDQAHNSKPLNIKEKLNISIDINNASCGNNNGSINITALSGSPPYTYSLDNIAFQNDSIFSNLSPGHYIVTLKDQTGCNNSQPADVSMTSDITLNAGNDTTICEGDIVKLNASSNAFNFQWSPNTGLSNANILQPDASPSSTTKYIITATSEPCSIKDSITVFVRPAPIANAGNDVSICFGQSTQLNGSGGNMYQWRPTTFLSDSSIGSPTVTNPVKGTLTYFLSVKDANNCSSLVEDAVNVTVTSAAVFAGNDTALTINQLLQLNAVDISNLGFNSYAWSPAYNLSNYNIQNPVATTDKDIVYTVTARNASGCVASDDIKITVYEYAEIYVPTGFSPNGDGKNDVLKAIPVGIREFKYFSVYNRWGQRIFNTADANKGWDGTINGQPQATGSFLWVAEGIDLNGAVLTKKGNITLIR